MDVVVIVNRKYKEDPYKKNACAAIAVAIAILYSELQLQLHFSNNQPLPLVCCVILLAVYTKNRALFQHI